MVTFNPRPFNAALRLPMPPTQNTMHAVVRGRLISSAKKREFKNQVSLFALKHKNLIQPILDALKGMQENDPNLALGVNCKFCFPFHKYYTKRKTIKKLDFDNRIKSTFDAVSELLEIDDKHFVQTYSKKVFTTKLQAYVQVTIFIAEHQSDKEE